MSSEDAPHPPCRQIAAGVAHVFNNLLTVIQGYSSLELTRTPRNSGLACSLREIADAAERGATVTRKLIACTSQRIIHLRPIDLNAHLASVASDLQSTMPAKIRLELRLDPDLPLLLIDPANFDEIISDLVDNARDALPDGGKIVIKTALDDVGEDDIPATASHVEAGRLACVTVEDNGTGITDEITAHLFEPFFTTKIGRGNGLGLAAAQGLARQHGGWIQVETVPGKGSAFRIFLPTPHLHCSGNLEKAAPRVAAADASVAALS